MKKPAKQTRKNLFNALIIFGTIAGVFFLAAKNGDIGVSVQAILGSDKRWLAAGLGVWLMSTVMEAIAGHHMGMRVCGISLVTNMAAGINTEPLSHEEVKKAGKDSSEYFSALVTDSLCAIKHQLDAESQTTSEK